MVSKEQRDARRNCGDVQKQKGRDESRPWCVVNFAFGYFNFARAALTASKFGKSFGVGVCSLYCTTPLLSITNAARAAVSPTPASIGNTTSYCLMTCLFKSLASVA